MEPPPEMHDSPSATNQNSDSRPPKRVKMEHSDEAGIEKNGYDIPDYRETARRGAAPVKAESEDRAPVASNGDDDAAEQSTFFASGEKAKTYGQRVDDRDKPRDDRDSSKKGKKKDKGQNKNRLFGASKDMLQLCGTRQLTPEFSPKNCQFGEKCKFEHDIRKYLKDGKREDLTTFSGVCPVWDQTGYCPAGWKCRFVRSHSKEIDSEDGRKELVLVEDEERMIKAGIDPEKRAEETGVYNVIPMKAKIDLERRRVSTKKADEYTKWLSETWSPEINKNHNRVRREDPGPAGDVDMESKDGSGETNGNKKDHRADYTEPPFRASEKRRLYYGPDTPVLAPLTTQGNMPFRHLCVELGAQITWSEMAMSLPLIQGGKSEWPLVKAHASEITPPVVKNTVVDYDNKVDMKFGVQISANKPWLAFKATEILSTYCSHLRAIDLNCGCPIDLVYETGAGSALLGNPSKLEKMLRGMNALSGDIPITAKIRTGIKDNAPNAASVAERLVIGGRSTQDAGLDPCGVAALTLHGRSRQQRYTKLANWSYIADVASMLKDLRIKQDEVADTVREADPRDQTNGGKVYFIGNGDVYSHYDYNEHIEKAGVDSVMIARGALIKPWIFEEISTNQYLDKSATERLTYIEKFCKFGMETWGSDEMGIGTTRRFLCEWLSFTCRYVPIGLLEYLPPKINERPPPYKGRNELETLMASDNYRDWIKISEMFLGPAHENFQFTPKHKSNAYEGIEAEG